MPKSKYSKLDENQNNISDQSLDEQALQWIVTLSSGEVDQKDIQNCKKWRKISKKHEYAFEKARKLWMVIGNTKHLHELEILSTSQMNYPTHFSLAFYILHTYKYLFIIIFCMLSFSTYYVFNRPDIETNFGEIQTLQLKDESKVILNTNTALNINITDLQREIILKHGEAYFETSHHTHKPFIVQTGNNTIEVNGSVFNVQLTKDKTIITSLKGQLMVSNHNFPTQHLQHNQQLIIDQNNSFTIEKLLDQNLASWISGTLQFKDVEIRDILEILKNYDQNFWIIHLNTQQKHMHLNTTVNINKIDDWLIGLTEILPVKVNRIGKFIFIYQ